MGKVLVSNHRCQESLEMQQLEDQATSWVVEVVEKVTAVSAAVQAGLEEAPWEEAC